MQKELKTVKRYSGGCLGEGYLTEVKIKEDSCLDKPINVKGLEIAFSLRSGNVLEFRELA